MKSKKKLSYQQKKKISYLIFMIPFLAGFFLLFVGIYANSLRFSFCNLEMLGADGYKLHFVGWVNYKFALLTDPYYVSNLRNSMTAMVSAILMATLYSLLMAVALNGRMKGRTVFRAIFFIPVILATGFVNKADAFAAIFSQQWNSMGAQETVSSVANGLISSREIRSILSNLSFSPQLSAYVISAVDGIFNIVNIAGVQMMIFLAGLQSISPAIYEAAEIDGASKWESFWMITFPMISPIILVNIIYTVVDSLTKPENVIMKQIQEQSFKANSMGIASAMAWMYFLLTAVFIGLIVLVVNRYVYYQQRE